MSGTEEISEKLAVLDLEYAENRAEEDEENAGQGQTLSKLEIFIIKLLYHPN